MVYVENENLSSIRNGINNVKTDTESIQAAQGLAAIGTTWFVDASVSSSGDGRTPDTAFKTIQEAVDAASSGDVIFIEAGEYDENAHPEGLKITKNNLRIISKPPFQAIIYNTHASSTSTIYVDGDYIYFSDLLLMGDVYNASYCSEGIIYTSGKLLRTTERVAAFGFSGSGFQFNGNTHFVNDCFTIICGIGFEFVTVVNSVLNNCVAMSIGAGTGFGLTSTGGDTNFFYNCGVVNVDTGISIASGSNDNLFVNFSFGNVTTAQIVDNGTNNKFINCGSDSGISHGNTLAEDLKTIYDDAKYLYSTALDGSETANSIGEKVSTILKNVRGTPKVYPDLANGVQLTAHATNAWTLGTITQVVPANTITNNFTIGGIAIDTISDTTKLYQVNLYYGDGDTFCGSFTFDANKFNGFASYPVKTIQIPANSKVSAAVACSGGAGETLNIKILYTEL